MDLHNVVKKAVLLRSKEELLPSGDKFYRLKGLSQAEMDRKMNERIVKTPPNLKLLESDTDDSIKENSINKIRSFDKPGIAAAIKEVTGGLEQSNEHWEKFWAKRLEDIMKSNMKKSYESSLHDGKANFGNRPKVKSSKQKAQLMKENNKIFRNAAIMGLVNTNKISLEDLADTNNKNYTKEDTQILDNEYQVEFVPLREDPEVFIHPLQMGINVKNCKDIDFTVPRIGKKIKETPQEYFSRTTNEDSFKFIKNNNTM